MGSRYQSSEGMTEKEKKAISNRLAKAIGHTKKVRNMVEDGQDCSEVLIQLSAVKAAVNSLGKEILRVHLNEIIEEVAQDKDMEKLDEINRIIEIFMK